jgi:hypothetical protein
MDPYAVLGVDRVAGPDEIDAAYTRRRRLHDPAAQETDEERAAAERFHAELDDAYRTLLGTIPSGPGVSATGDDATASASTRTARRPASRPAARATSTPGRDVLVVLGTLVGAYVVILLSVTVAPGFGGLILGVVAAVALVSAVLVRERGRRA